MAVEIWAGPALLVLLRLGGDSVDDPQEQRCPVVFRRYVVICPPSRQQQVRGDPDRLDQQCQGDRAEFGVYESLILAPLGEDVQLVGLFVEESLQARLDRWVVAGRCRTLEPTRLGSHQSSAGWLPMP